VLPWQAHGDEFANFIVRPRTYVHTYIYAYIHTYGHTHIYLVGSGSNSDLQMLSYRNAYKTKCLLMLGSVCMACTYVKL